MTKYQKLAGILAAGILLPITLPRLQRATSRPPRAAPAVKLAAFQLTAIPEELATAVFYVDGQNPAAADDNPGSDALPFKTVARAVQAAEERNQTGVGAKILIRPGLYREAIVLSNTGAQTDAPMILQGTVHGAVTLTGADPWTGWQNAGVDIYRHAWPYRWGLAPYPSGWQGQVTLSPIVRRREMVSIDGKRLTQVLSPEELKANTFYVAEEIGTLYVMTSPGVVPDTVEVATRPRLLAAERRRNLVLRDLKFTFGNAAVQGGAVEIVGSANVLIENCEFSMNNWIGLSLSGVANLTARGNTANYNGATGIDGYQMQNAFFDGNETSFNNWRGAQGGLFGWAPAGSKLTSVHGAVIRGHRSWSNSARGFWLDYDNSNISIEGALWCSNLNDGVFIEANQGPIVIKGAQIWNNRNGSGILGANSSHVLVQSSVILGNEHAQIAIAGDLDRSVTDWESGVSTNIRASDWTLRENVLTSVSPGQLLFETPEWNDFLSTLTTQSNQWVDADNRSFRIGSRVLTFGQWQSVTHESGSTFGAPHLNRTTDRSGFEGGRTR